MEGLATAIKLIGGKHKDDPGLQMSMHKLGQMMGEESERINGATKINQPLGRLDDFRPHVASSMEYFYNQMFVLNNTENVEYALRMGDKDATHKQLVNSAMLKGLLWKKRGTVLLKQAKYPEAREAYLTAMRATLRQDATYVLPSPDAWCEAITKVDSDLGVADVFACANNVAQCYIKEGNIIKALEWLEEVNNLYESFSTPRKKELGTPSFPWKEIHLNYEEWVTVRARALLRQVNIWRDLGNHGAAYGAAMAAISWGIDLVSTDNAPATIKALREECDIMPYFARRYPDPFDFEDVRITNPQLQVRGVWKKLRVGGERSSKPPSRLAPATFVHKGYFYVFGGEIPGNHGICRRDGWVLNLRDLDASWRKLPSCPSTADPDVCYMRFVVWNDKAYLFQGLPDVATFDLRSETWSLTRTRMRDGSAWNSFFPGRRRTLRGYIAEGDGAGRIYIFGGQDDHHVLGRNTLAVLDIEARTWDIRAGRVEVNDDPTVPGPREHCASWSVDGKMYVSLGNANRGDALINKSAQGASHDYSYRDIWSLDMENDKWTQERYLGNSPCLRTEIGYGYNQVWREAIVFGGYCETLSYKAVDSNSCLNYTYFGDTFVWSPDTKLWRHVLTRGFPTYRACPDVFVDQETGRTYMYGGYTSTTYTPSRKETVTQVFNDLWELCLDVPGGGFQESDWGVNPKFSSLGPWRRCFHCGEVGRWMVCAGSCRETNAAAAFCGKECARVAWPEHKAGGCRKI